MCALACPLTDGISPVTAKFAFEADVAKTPAAAAASCCFCKAAYKLKSIMAMSNLNIYLRGIK